VTFEHCHQAREQSFEPLGQHFHTVSTAPPRVNGASHQKQESTAQDSVRAMAGVVLADQRLSSAASPRSTGRSTS
jgi:hypothetical protein